MYFVKLLTRHISVSGGYLCTQIFMTPSCMRCLHSSTLPGVIVVRHVAVNLSFIHSIQYSAENSVESNLHSYTQ